MKIWADKQLLDKILSNGYSFYELRGLDVKSFENHFLKSQLDCTEHL